MDLSKLTTPRINYLRENLNLTEDEEKVFAMLSKKKSRQEISDKLRVSISTTDKLIRQIKGKIKMLEEDNKKGAMYL